MSFIATCQLQGADASGRRAVELIHRHHLIVVYKTAFYSFYLPVALAMRMVRRLPLLRVVKADM